MNMGHLNHNFLIIVLQFVNHLPLKVFLTYHKTARDSCHILFFLIMREHEIYHHH